MPDLIRRLKWQYIRNALLLLGLPIGIVLAHATTDGFGLDPITSTTVIDPITDSTALSSRSTPLAQGGQSQSMSAFVPQQVPAQQGLSLSAVGDLMLGSAYPILSELPPQDGQRVLEAVSPLLSATDVAFANLEGVLTDQLDTVRNCGASNACFRFAMPSRYVQHLKQAGIDAVSLANNHAFDAGDAGIASSKRHLEQQLVYFGSEQQPTALHTLADGRVIGWVGFAPHSGSNRPTVEKITQQVQTLKAQAQFVVVSFHGGAEGVKAQRVTRQDEIFMGQNRGNIYQLAHAAVDAGADVVLGHGPHVLRAMEVYKGRLIAYSLGNFATYGRFNLRDENGLAGVLQAQLDADGRFVSGRFVSTIQVKNSPAWQAGIGPVIDPTHTAAANLRSLSLADFPESPLHIAADGQLSLTTTPAPDATSSP